MNINTGWTPLNDGHIEAIASVFALVSIIGVEAYREWCDEQRGEGDTIPWVVSDGVYDWPKLTELARAEYDRLTADECDCGANGRDACPDCAVPTVITEELPY